MLQNHRKRRLISITLRHDNYCRLGNAVAGVIRIELKAAVDELKATYGVVPGLAVVLVG